MATPSKTAPKADVKGAAVNVKEAEKRNLPQPQPKAQTNEEAKQTLPPTQASAGGSSSEETEKAAQLGEQTLRTREAVEAAKSTPQEDTKPQEDTGQKEIVEAARNLELTGHLIRGYGMGVDDATREQFVKSNHVMAAETPDIEMTVNKDVEKAVKAEEEAGEKATRDAERELAKDQSGNK